MPEHLQLPFPDVAGPAARATQPPPFDEIVARARRRRRRTVLGAAGVVAVAVIAVAAGATLTTGDDGSAPQPVGPSPSATTSPSPTPAPRRDADPAEVVRDGRLVSMAVSAKGSLLTVWQRCENQGARCRTAWQLQGGAGITRALVRGNFASAEAAGDSIVVTSWDHLGVVVDEDGRSRPLQAIATGTVTPGDALIRLGKSLAVIDPVAAASWPLPVPDGVEGWVHGTIAPDGTVWALPFRAAPPIDVRVSWLEPGTTAWRNHVISTSFRDGPGPGPLAVANDHAATMSLHDGVDVASYGRFAITTDAGASWSDLRSSDLPFDNVDAMAATSGGTLYVASTDATGVDRVFRSTDATWRHFAEVPGARGAYELVAAGARVVAARGPQTGPEVLTLDDAGHATVWAEFR